jgi:hypothetical protein
MTGVALSMLVACGAPNHGEEAIDYRPAAGKGGTGGEGGTAPGGSGFGGTIPPLIPGGSAGAAGRTGGTGGGGPTPPEAPPYTEEVVEAEDSPPPIAGGTLAIVAQGHWAAVSDPDHDQVVVVDLDSMTIVSTIALLHGDDPGRLVEDGGGRLHVALRGGRAVAVLDPSSGAVLRRLAICDHPRGLAFQAAADAIHVACAGGELVSYTASAGVLQRKLRLERDLRDVVVDGDHLLVSRFRAAEILVVEASGAVSHKLQPPVRNVPIPGQSTGATVAAVAWRTIPSPDGGALMVYQVLRPSSVETTLGGYGGSCGGIISTAVSVLRVDGSSSTVENISAVLPVDIATTASRHVSVVSAAWTPRNASSLPDWVATFDPPAPSPAHPRLGTGCKGPPPPFPPPLQPGSLASEGPPQPQGRPVAIGYAPNETIIVQTREPATLMFGDRFIVLPGRARKHTGHELFHLGTVGGLACASCHPEGHDDGQVWNFAKLGPRRTQSVSGGISGTEPFHWSGDMETFTTLAHDVFNSRMSGPLLTSEHVESMFRWIDRIPRMLPPTADDPAAVERGRVLFSDADVGCAGCHSGEKMTNNTTVDVNTGGTFQVPSLLGLAWRAPYMHQGCAPTLAARFDSCGGGDDHGHTSQLSAEQRADLVAYLDTL